MVRNLANLRWLIFFVILSGSACSNQGNPTKSTLPTEQMMIRIAALEIDANHIPEYLEILKEEAAESVKLESGVIAIYPMYEKETPTSITIIEIYANEAAYQSHLKTPHFLHYKTSTKNMVKSLKLIDMEAIDHESMFQIFKKLQ